ncbi:MAG: hypothetical protein JW881_13625 [Spirochaetales bacterium]|nr:hypothetical protein [Spirochaetales bacterium]
MSSTVIFLLFIAVAAPLFLFIFSRIYKRSIVFAIISVVFIIAILTALVAYLSGEWGLMHLIWGVPLVLVSMFACFALINRIISKPIKATVAFLNRWRVENSKGSQKRGTWRKKTKLAPS